MNSKIESTSNKTFKMNSINFQNLSIKQNIIWIILILSGLLFTLLDVFEVFSFSNPIISKYISTFFYLVLTIYFSRAFWGKNVIQWNKKGMTARVNNFWGITIDFAKISKLIFEENKITITYMSGEKKVINLNKIDINSKKRLAEILNSNSSIIA